MGRTCTDYHIDRMLLEIFLEKTHRGQNPKAARVRNKAVAPYPEHQVLHFSLFLGIDGSDYSIGVICPGIRFSRQPAHNGVGLENLSPDHLHLSWNFILK